MSKAEDLDRLGKMLDEGKINRLEYDQLKAELMREDQHAPATSVTPATPKPEPSVSGSDQVRWWLIGAGALMAIGSFLPWAQAGIFSFAGTRGDGVITLVAGGFVALVGLIPRRSKLGGVLVMVLSGLSLVIVGNVFNNLDTNSLGGGLFVTGLGGLLGVVAGVKTLSA